MHKKKIAPIYKRKYMHYKKHIIKPETRAPCRSCYVKNKSLDILQSLPKIETIKRDYASLRYYKGGVPSTVLDQHQVMLHEDVIRAKLPLQYWKDIK